METSHSKAWRSRYAQNAAVCSFRNDCALQNLNKKSPLVFFIDTVSMEISIKCFVYFQLLSSVCLSLSHGCPQWPCRGSWGQFEPWLGTAVLPWFTHSVFRLQQGQEQQLSHRGSFCFWTVTTEHSHSKGRVYFKRRLNLQNSDLIIQLLMTNEFCVLLIIFLILPIKKDLK